MKARKFVPRIAIASAAMVPTAALISQADDTAGEPRSSAASRSESVGVKAPVVKADGTPVVPPTELPETTAPSATAGDATPSSPNLRVSPTPAAEKPPSTEEAQTLPSGSQAASSASRGSEPDGQREVEEYWTPDRMRDAEPAPMPTVPQ